MDTHNTEVREIANLLDEVEVIIPEDTIVYYTLKNLPKEYEIFKRMQITAQTMPTYEQLEAKLISEKTSIWLETQKEEDGEAFFLHRNRSRRPQPTSTLDIFKQLWTADTTPPTENTQIREDPPHQDIRIKWPPRSTHLGVI